MLRSALDASGSPTLTFGNPVDCGAVADVMVGNLTNSAREGGARILQPFTVRRCDGTYLPDADPPVNPTLRVCGAFRSQPEAAKLQSYLAEIVESWVWYVYYEWAAMLELSCPPAGYIVSGEVEGSLPDGPSAVFQAFC
jgi:hypothetical protein